MRWHVSDVLLPVSLILWAVGVARTDTRVIGAYGLLTILPLTFYAGIALLIVSATAELFRDHFSRWRMSVHTVALVVMLYGTAPIVYPEGRYAWLYKTIGVVQYINAHGQLNSHIDIYQNWAGFFAFAAWFDKVAGVASPLTYAKWTQLVVELAALPLLNLIYKALALPVRQRWVALLLYSASNWIAQDYFSPQAPGLLLSLGIMAIAMRWMFVGNSSGRIRDRHGRGDDFEASPDFRPLPGQQFLRRADRPEIFFVALVLIYFVLTFTHELSPYIVVTQLGVLAIIGLFRSRWLVVALAAVAVGYFLPRFSFVNSHYNISSSIGAFFSNIAPPSAANSGYHIPSSQLIIQRCAEALSVVIWLLSLMGAWLRRRSLRSVIALVLLAYSPFLVLFLGAYGDEGILRVYLFSLPWSAALAAAVLAPAPAQSANSSRPDLDRNSWGHRRLPAGAFRTPIILCGILVLFLVAFFGDDQVDVMTQPEVAAITSFMQTAPAGPVFYAIYNAPADDTSRYNLFPLAQIFGIGAVWGTKPPRPDIADVLATEADRYTLGRQPSYVVVTPAMIGYARAYGIPVSDFTGLLDSLAQSKAWKLTVSNAGAVIYELPPMTFVQGFRAKGLIPDLLVP